MYIYKIENTVNGKVYIGRTNNAKHREQHHFSNLKHGKHKNPNLQSEYNEHGRAAFEFSVIETTKAKDVVDREQYWIAQYSDRCYNIKGRWYGPSKMARMPSILKRVKRQALKKASDSD